MPEKYGRPIIFYTLGELIRERREEKGISRNKLARIIGISPNSMVKYELAGKPEGQYPSFINICRICTFLGIDPRDAFSTLHSTGDLDDIEGKGFFEANDPKVSERALNDIQSDVRITRNEVDRVRTEIEGIYDQLEKLNEALVNAKQNGPNQSSLDRSGPANNLEAAPTASVTRRRKT